jgi:prolyl oligopeptidase
MNRKACLILLVSLLGCAERQPVVDSPPSLASSAAPAVSLGRGYPATKADAIVDTLHGVRVEDPYRWLEDAANNEVRAWMDAQDAYGRKALDALPLTNELRARFTELYYTGFKTAPWRRGKRWFWVEQDAKQEKAVIYFREGKDGPRRVLLDPNTWSTDGSVALGAWFVSRNGKIVAYQVKSNAADEATLEFIDIASGKKLTSDTIEGAKYTWELAWAPNEDGVYYTWVPAPGTVPTADRPGQAEIRFHKLGTDPKKDPTIHAKTNDPTTFVYASSFVDDKYAFYVVRHGWVSRDVYFVDLQKPGAKWQPLVVGQKASYYPTFVGGKFYVRTDEGAARFRVFQVDPKRPGRDAWVEIVPEHPTQPLQSVSFAGGRMVHKYLDDVKSRIEVRTLDGKLERNVDLPGVGSSSLDGHPEDDDAYLTYTTFTVPAQIFRTSVKKGGLDLYSKVEVPFDSTPYAVEQIFAKSKDGTRVPAFVIRRKGQPLDGSSPVLMYGYGGYAVSTLPGYWGSIVPWLERGGTAVFANIRGGGEYGEAWHKAGMRRNKQNVFDDFNAVAEHLIREKYTAAERLAIRGDSNGGLLVSAALTQRPDLYRAVLCGVPLTDMVRYHLVGAGKTWIEEFGTPDDAGDFAVLNGLSPYHHVKAGTKYPAVLVLTSDTDDRVDPMHARKMAAMLQARSAGGDVLLRIEKNAGHGGADTIKSAVDMRAQSLAFVMHEVGMDTAPRR